MNTLLAPLWEISEFEEIQKQLDKENGCVALTVHRIPEASYGLRTLGGEVSEPDLRHL